MTITLELSPEAEAKLREGIAQNDAETIRQLLADALTPAVETLLQSPPDQLSEADLETLFDLLADETAVSVSPNAPLLSDYATSRAGIYEDHP